MASTQGERKYDLIVFGATGFTGQYVVEELARTVGEERRVTWAVAGRDMPRLQDVLRAASKKTGVNVEDLPIIIVNLQVESSLHDMAKQARIILNCVGPYRFYGDKVIRACVENKSHHLDISGEPGFLEKVQLLYNTKAREQGIYIIGSCGFDSVPSDMGVVYTAEQFLGELNSVEGYLAIKTGPQGGKINYGTWQSAIHGFANMKETISQRKKLYMEPLPKPQHKLNRRKPVFFSDDVNSWCVPFPGSDRSIVNRTQRYLHDNYKERPVQFNAFLRLPSLFSTMLLAFFVTIFGLFASFKLGRFFLEKFPGLFSAGTVSHDGPTREQIDGASFSYTLVGQGYATKDTELGEPRQDLPSTRIITRVSGPEPGYVTTPICLVQSAYVLLSQTDKLPKGGGVFTPGAAFYNTNLIDRLDKHNIKFRVVEKATV